MEQTRAPGARPRAPLSLRLSLALGLLANAGVAILLIAISGFIFGTQEGAGGEASAVMGWGFTLGSCLLSPALALWLWRTGRRGGALAMMWLPPLAFVVGAVLVL